MKQWRCTVCDFIHKGDSLPENCPMCGSESSLFVAAGDETTPAVSDGQTDADGALRWQCVVCGYIHTGPEPPDKCPVCGADRSQFVCLDRETEASETPPQTATTETDRRWRCTICGYIHTGPEPPSVCPVCGADRSMFEEVVEAPAAAPESKTGSTAQPGPAGEPGRPGADAGAGRFGMVAQINARLDRYRHWIDLAIENHAHPIAVHVPNGVIPIVVVMVVMAALFDMPMLGKAGFYNMVFILLSMPAVLFTGYLHWQYKFGGHMTALFRNKLISAAVVTALALVLVLWGMLDPRIAAQPGFLYVALHLVMLGVAAYAGYLGGRLVFHRAS